MITPEEVLKAAEELEQFFAGMNTTMCSNCKSRAWTPRVESYEARIAGIKSSMTINRGCCALCSGSHGYYHVDENTGGSRGDAYRHIKPRYWWDKVYGFFNPVELHCNLPRYLRSPTCLGYMCSEMYDHHKKLCGGLAAAQDNLEHKEDLIGIIRKFRRDNPDTWYKEETYEISKE